MEKLKFWDLKGKKSFTTDEYTKVTKGKARFAVADAPSGIKSWRLLGKK